jgi:hypothetical protein
MVVLWYQLLAVSRRDNVVSMLQSKALSRAGTRTSARIWKRRDGNEDGSLLVDGAVMADLGFLGREGRGAEKQVVLSALQNVGDCIIEDEDYKGRGLDRVVSAIAETLSDGDGDDATNLHAGAFALRRLRNRVKEKGHGGMPDSWQLDLALERLGVAAVERADADAASTIVGYCETGRSLAAVGLAAIHAQRPVIALQALNLLEELARNGTLSCRDDTAHLLSLFAGLHQCGGSVQRITETRFAELKGHFLPDVHECVEWSCRRFIQLGDFVSADAVVGLEGS